MMISLVREESYHTDVIDGSERRRGLRISQARPIKLFEPRSARFIGGQTHDISASGLRIELPMSSPVGVGKVVNIHVGTNEQGQGLANRRGMIPARIVWIERGLGTRLTAGVEFMTGIAVHRDAA